MIAVILSAVLCCVLVSAVVRGISDTLRGILCWTFSAVGFVASAVIYASQSGGFTPKGGEVLTGLAGAALIAVVFFAIELLAPAKRLKGKQNAEYDRFAAEKALNVVMIIVTGACCAAAVICDISGHVEFAFLGIVPAAAVSLRQLSYFMYLVKQDSLSQNNPKQKREKLLRSLSGGKRSL